jgi:hypothetical protein
MGVADPAVKDKARAKGAAFPARPSLPNLSINNLDTFDIVTTGKKNGGSRQVAGLYFYLQLDCLVDYAYRVASDFFIRPHLYVKLEDPSIVEALVELGARSGSNELFPSQGQRDAIYLPIFGQSSTELSDGKSNFPRLRDELVAAAAAFAERVFNTGEEMLRERVRTTHRPFRDYLTGLQGDSVTWSRQDALAGVTESLAYNIMRNKGVAAVFGISSPPGAAWPYTEDANGDKLVEEISKQLVVATNSHTPITREGFSNRQRVALRGAEALATIIDFVEGNANPDDLNLLITRCYTWGSALRSLQGYPAVQSTMMT